MTIRSFLAAAVLCATAPWVFTARAQAAAPQSRDPVVVANFDPAADLAGAELFIPAGLDRQTPAQNGIAALVAESILQTPVQTGVPLEKAIRNSGGSITYVMEPHDVRFYLEGLTPSFGSLVGLFRDALGHPDFSSGVLARARDALDRKRSISAQLALNVGIDMLNRVFYAGSDAGLPPFGLPEIVAGLSPADAGAFYGAFYRRTGAVISAAGNTGSPDAYAHVLDVLPQGESSAAVVRQSPLPSLSRQLIARRDVPVPWLVAQYPAPPLRSRDFGAMLVLVAFMQRTLGEVGGIPRIAAQSAAESGIGALYNFDAQPANVIIFVDGGMGDPTRTFATALTVVNVLGHARLSGDLSDMKTIAAGNFARHATTLQERAWLAGVFASQGMPSDYFSEAMAAIEQTTAADLQRVAARYLGSPTIALVLPRGT